MLHGYAYMGARLSYSCNEISQNIYYCVINPKCHYMQWHTLCAATRPFISVQQLA